MIHFVLILIAVLIVSLIILFLWDETCFLQHHWFYPKDSHTRQCENCGKRQYWNNVVMEWTDLH